MQPETERLMMPDLKELLNMLPQLQRLSFAVVPCHIALHPAPLQQPWHEGLQRKSCLQGEAVTHTDSCRFASKLE